MVCIKCIIYYTVSRIGNLCTTMHETAKVFSKKTVADLCVECYFSFLWLTDCNFLMPDVQCLLSPNSHLQLTPDGCMTFS